MAKETLSFQAEVQQILDLMIHSLYSHKEIFLRELISNGSDALDKLRFEAKTNSQWKLSDEESSIRLTPNSDKKTLTIEDNGIGMNREEVQKNIGTIAHSGTKAFLENAQKIKENPELIGQFGVGFYSAFMVADKITLHTQRAGSSEGVLWESTGNGEYTISDVPRAGGHGTTITLHLKEFAAEEEVQDFTQEWVLKGLVKKYSDFIEYPIRMQVTRQEPVRDEEGKVKDNEYQDVIDDQILNSRKALWLQNPKEIKEDEYNQFYKDICHDWTDPLKTIHFRAEGMQEFSALMFIPSQKPFDFNSQEHKWGLSLYVKRVFIMDNAEELLPTYFRFIKGIVDSSDLSLNVSREILQQDRQVSAIRKALTSKILSYLKDELKDNREAYEKFWKTFGATLKEGIPGDHSNKEKIEKLCLFRSTKQDGFTTIEEYISRMPETQKEIYFLTGDHIDQLKNSPYIEAIEEKGYEVLLLTDAVDEWVMGVFSDQDGKKLKSVTANDLELDSEEEKKAKEDKLKEDEKKYEKLTSMMQKALETNVSTVKLSSRLKSAPVCFVAGEQEMSARMERMMEAMGQKVPVSKRTLEINPDHPVIEKMMQIPESEQETWAEILYNQALLNEGSPIKDPVRFSQKLTQLMSKN